MQEERCCHKEERDITSSFTHLLMQLSASLNPYNLPMMKIYFVLELSITYPVKDGIFYISIWFDISRGGSRRVAKLLQESILIAFDSIWRVLLSGKNFATLIDPPLKCHNMSLWVLQMSEKLSNSTSEKHYHGLFF